MSKQPLGKTLLRNVIRHTDAHNKIQEETEMWKMRGWEVQTSHQKDSVPGTGCLRGQMHCDRLSDSTRGRSREHVSEHDDREARYWTRKLYNFEDNDPDRWGHSGFKELYPEEFESDSENSDGAKKIRRHRIKKSKSGTESTLSKRSKKSSRKKKKKKKKKKGEEEKRKKTARSISDSSSSSEDDSSSADRDKQRRKKSKSRHKNKKGAKSRGIDGDSSSGESDDHDDDDKGKNRRTHSRKRRNQDSYKDSDSGLSSKKKKRRKNWKAGDRESSGDSSGD